MEFESCAFSATTPTEYKSNPMDFDLFQSSQFYSSLGWHIAPVEPSCPSLEPVCDLHLWSDSTFKGDSVGIGVRLGPSGLVAVTTDCQGWLANRSGIPRALLRHPTVTME